MFLIFFTLWQQFAFPTRHIEEAELQCLFVVCTCELTRLSDGICTFAETHSRPRHGLLERSAHGTAAADEMHSVVQCLGLKPTTGKSQSQDGHAVKLDATRRNADGESPAPTWNMEVNLGQKKTEKSEACGSLGMVRNTRERRKKKALVAWGADPSTVKSFVMSSANFLQKKLLRAARRAQ